MRFPSPNSILLRCQVSSTKLRFTLSGHYPIFLGIYFTTYFRMLLLMTMWKFLCGPSFGMSVPAHLPWWLCAHSSDVCKSTAELLHRREHVCSAYVSHWKAFKEEIFQGLCSSMWVRVMTEEKVRTPSGSLVSRAEDCGRRNFWVAFSRKSRLPWGSFPAWSSEATQFRIFLAAA